MTHTTFRDDHTMLIPNRALAYDPGPENGYKLDVSYYEQLGDGAVHTSVEDLKKWDDNFYSGRIGGKAFLDELQQTGKLNNGKPLDYAKGLFISTHRGLRTVRHGGAWGGYRAELLRFPDQHFSVACLCNVASANPEKRADEVAEIYLCRSDETGEGNGSAGGKRQDSSRRGAHLATDGRRCRNLSRSGPRNRGSNFRGQRQAAIGNLWQDPRLTSSQSNAVRNCSTFSRCNANVRA